MLEVYLYPQKLAQTSPTSGGRSVGIIRLQTKAREFFFNIKMNTIERNKRDFQTGNSSIQLESFARLFNRAEG
jgi:hypothetical protein